MSFFLCFRAKQLSDFIRYISCNVLFFFSFLFLLYVSFFFFSFFCLICLFSFFFLFFCIPFLGFLFPIFKNLGQYHLSFSLFLVSFLLLYVFFFPRFLFSFYIFQNGRGREISAVIFIYGRESITFHGSVFYEVTFCRQRKYRFSGTLEGIRNQIL